MADPVQSQIPPASKLTQERLREVLSYDLESGVFIWRKAASRRIPAGSIAGHLMPNGYWRITFDKTQHSAHRLAFLYMTGSWPPEEVDHIDGVKSNNRWANLRPATKSQNAINRRSRRPNGMRGASFHKETGKYVSLIYVGRKQINLGYFDSAEQAHAAYLAASQKYHGDFARSD